MSLFAELKRRNVIRVGAAYMVATWLLLQVVDVLSPILELPAWAPKLMFLILSVGFVPVLIFAWAFELTPEGIKREKEVNRDTSITHATAKKLDYITIGLVAAAILIVVVDRILPQSTPDTIGGTQISASSQTAPQNSLTSSQAALQHSLTSSQAAQQSGTQSENNENVNANVQNRLSEQATAPPPKSIAVLPFVNMSADASNEYFSDGISEEILNALAKVTDLKVAGRTSSFAFKGQNQDLRQIGSALNVSHILEGSVRKAGNRVRITAQLIKVDDGYHVWSENYDRELDDIFAIQDEISASILQELKAHLIGDAPTAVARTDSQTYDFYLLASQRIYERNQASLQMASDLLSQAIAIDPGYAPAYAQLGIATLLLSKNNYGDLPVQESASKARSYLDRALELNANQAEAMAGMGLYYYDSQVDTENSILWFEKALLINPNLVNANVWLSTALSDLGELGHSVAILEATFSRDPLHPPTFNNLSQNYSVMGESEKARGLLTDLKRYLPGDAGLIASIGKVEVMAGNFTEADKLLSQAVEREPLNWTDRAWLSATALGTRQYERIAKMGTDNFKALALNQLGRTEESVLLALGWTNEGNGPGEYFEILTSNGRFEEVIKFLESRWPDLDAFERDFPNRGGFGSNDLGYIAQAYGRLGKEAKYDDAMARFKASLDMQVEQGANNWVLSTSRAYYAMLAGDHDSAVGFLEEVLRHRGLPRLDMTSQWSVFAPLRGDRRFEAVLSRLTEHVNEERAALGLQPLST